ncbi:hypothetical protein HOP50_10g57990 [Chloropicon primus]|nr:hypothetical protein HOP50_10g57990 [Chloropicon primus]
MGLVAVRWRAGAGRTARGGGGAERIPWRRRGWCHGGCNSTAVASTRFEDVAETLERECGISKRREVEIVVDVLTNPASGFLDRGLANKFRSFQVKEVDTDIHIKPVASFLKELGATPEQIRRMVIVHPPVVVYDVETHLRPLIAYLNEIVEWLQSDGYSKDQIVEYLCKSL